MPAARLLPDPLKHLLELSRDTGRRHVIALAGYPGSGKSTLCSRWESEVAGIRGPGILTVLGMDGFHLSRAKLAEMEDPREAMARRGAPWTFDPDGLVAKMKELRRGWDAAAVGWPGFDHGVGDPEPDALSVPANAPLIIVEGIYTLLRSGPWAPLEDLFDETWYLDVPIETAMDRITLRHARVWNMSPEAARTRADSNDRLNCAHIYPGRETADFRVENPEKNRR